MRFLHPVFFSFALSHVSAHPVLPFTFLHFLFLLISVSFFNALSYYICFFLCASFKKKLSMCASDSYIVHFIPAPAFFLCLCILYSHAFILYSFCFLCILSVFIPYCIFFNLQIFILSFFVHLQIIFFKFSVHIHCLSWSFFFFFALYIFNNFFISSIVFIFSVLGYTSITKKNIHMFLI